MSDGYAIEAGLLAATAETLATVSGELRGQVASLALTPDAGSTSGEVSSAFADLSEGLDALARAVSGAAEQLRQTEATYQGSDDHVARTYGPTSTP